MTVINDFIKDNGIEVLEISTSGFDGYEFRKGEKTVRVAFEEYPEDDEEREEFIISKLKELI